jgi:hypothetical protein
MRETPKSLTPRQKSVPKRQGVRRSRPCARASLRNILSSTLPRNDPIAVGPGTYIPREIRFSELLDDQQTAIHFVDMEYVCRVWPGPVLKEPGPRSGSLAGADLGERLSPNSGRGYTRMEELKGHRLWPMGAPAEAGYSGPKCGVASRGLYPVA